MNKLLVSALSCVFLSACSAPAVKDSAIIQQSAIEQAKTVNLSPQQVLDETRDLQVLAQREDLYFYSPNYIAQAENEIRQAEDALKGKLPPQQIITHALTGQQLLKRGLETKQTVLTQLKLTLDGLAMLRELKTEKLMASEFSDIQGETKDLIILVEQGNTSQALKEQADVLAEIAILEINVLKKTYLSQAEIALEKAEDADAEDHAAVSFEQASVAVERLQAFIEANPKKRQDINLKTQDTVRLCQHAQNVASAAKPLLKLTNEGAEQHVLFIEKLIARIGHALKHEDVSYLPLDNQSIALAQAAETINKQAQSFKQQGQWEKEKAELQAKLNNLQSQLNTATQASIIEEPKINETELKDSSKILPMDKDSNKETKPETAIDQVTENSPATPLKSEVSQEPTIAPQDQTEATKKTAIDETVATETQAPSEAVKEEIQTSNDVAESTNSEGEIQATSTIEAETPSSKEVTLKIAEDNTSAIEADTQTESPQDLIEAP